MSEITPTAWNAEQLEEAIALEAVGALDPSDRAPLEARLAADASARSLLASSRDAMARYATLTAPPQQPPAGWRERILRRMVQTPQEAKPEAPRAEVPLAPTAAGPQGTVPFRFVLAGEGPWFSAPVAGGRFKLLSMNREAGYAMIYMELGPNSRYPEHDHAGQEELYVLTGDLLTEGRRLGPGDFVHAEPGSHHGELTTVGGCTALLIVPLAALQTSGVG